MENKSIQVFYKQIRLFFHQSWIILGVVSLILVMFLYGMIRKNLKEEADAEVWSFERQLRFAEEVSRMYPYFPSSVVSRLKIDARGVIVQGSPKWLENLYVGKSGLFQKIQSLEKDDIFLLFYPDFSDMVRRVFFVIRTSQGFEVTIFNPTEFFLVPEGAHTHVYILDQNDICVYSSHPEFIGDELRFHRFFMSSGKIFVAEYRNLQNTGSLRLVIVHDSTWELFGVLLVFFLGGGVFMLMNRRTRKLDRGLALLEQELSTMTAIVEELAAISQIKSKKIRENFAEASAIISRSSEKLREFSPQFLESRQYLSLLMYLGNEMISLFKQIRKNALVIQKSEERYRDLYENAPNAYFSINPADGTILNCNSEAVKLFGYERAILTQMKTLDLYADTPHGKPMMKELFKHFKAEKSLSGVECQIKHETGRPIWVSLSAEAVKDQEGNMTEIRAILVNISERKFLEDQLYQAQKMEALGTLAGGIAHDFNNILSIIIGFTQLACNEIPSDSSLQEDLQEVLKAALRAKELVQQIFVFTKQKHPELKPVQVKTVLEETLKFLKASLPATIEVHSNIQSGSTVISDPTQIHQVLMNLCTNAGHAMQESGGVLEIELTDVELDSEEAARYIDLLPGAYVRLVVRDTGCGMQPEVLQRIFDPFFTTKSQAEGTGLGLSVVHGIVKSYGGAITVSSALGEGSTFSVFIPRFKEEIEPEIEISDSLPTGTERILFVDDEQSLADMGKKALGQLGYRVVAQTDSMKALALFQARPKEFDLVITDMTMPNVSGDELAKAILNLRPDIPVILCTGFSTKMDQEKADALGIQALIAKPVRLQEIAEVVRKVLDEKVTN